MYSKKEKTNNVPSITSEKNVTGSSQQWNMNSLIQGTNGVEGMTILKYLWKKH
jgi:hypothetical protein